jgi:hypothetical protein
MLCSVVPYVRLTYIKIRTRIVHIRFRIVHIRFIVHIRLQTYTIYEYSFIYTCKRTYIRLVPNVCRVHVMDWCSLRACVVEVYVLRIHIRVYYV